MASSSDPGRRAQDCSTQRVTHIDLCGLTRISATESLTKDNRWEEPHESTTETPKAQNNRKHAKKHDKEATQMSERIRPKATVRTHQRTAGNPKQRKHDRTPACGQNPTSEEASSNESNAQYGSHPASSNHRVTYLHTLNVLSHATP